ncbi:hypothetical protein [Tengunoibacter tsumagoiensis]|uniref:Uncharacterized protein n=1 Tax=Tengunoibacter tsumagoiensis TaxID=2014871 RepID=A0A401ZZ10_9CHLR|nr:hypothetical protein [Tengunoibacter tsumagoiensis]GCE12089.1 hypothetical protein KTT_19480 [Tengunoibacter tsumagoiensis]
MWPFNQNNQPMYQQYANSWDQGNYHQIPHQEAWQNYNQFIQNAPPQMVDQVHQQYYQQMPQEQRGGLLQSIMNGLTQRGIDPRQSGIQNTDPYAMSPVDASRLTGYAQQQQPDILHQIFSPGGALGSPIAKMAVAGIAALAAKQILGGGGFGGGGNLGGNNRGGLL